MSGGEKERRFSVGPIEEELYFDKKRRESSSEFVRRQWMNLTHLLVEDWFMCACLGMIMAGLSVIMDYWIEHLQLWHVVVLHRAAALSSVLAFFSWCGYLLFFVLMAATFVRYVSPAAVGSGIPEVKTILHGVMMKEYVSFRALIAKMVGLTLALGGGLPIGKEGPFVHTAAAVATLLSKMTSSCKHNQIYANESRYSSLLAAACAVGVSCTFSAPVGGVLFSIEVTSMYFAVRNYWHGFFAAACSAIVFRMLRYFLQSSGTAVVAFYQTNFPNDAFLPEELLLFAFLGIICGFVGALFIYLHRRLSMMLKHNQMAKRLQSTHFLLYPAMVVMLIGCITYPFGFGRLIAGQLKFRECVQDFFANCTWSLTTGASSDRITCGRDLLDHWTGGGGDGEDGQWNVIVTLSFYIVSYFVMCLFCVTLPIPCGVFMPTFVVGASIGRWYGEIVAVLMPQGLRGIEFTQIFPGIYSIVGAAAMSGAVTHTVSVAVIVFELTGQLNFILPVLMATLLAHSICKFLQPSIFDSIIRLKRLPYLPELPPARISVHKVKAEDIMVTKLFFITRDTTYRQLRALLSEAPTLHAFPIVTDNESRILLGSVSKRYLMRLVRQHLAFDQKKRQSIEKNLMLTTRSENLFIRRGSAGSSLPMKVKRGSLNQNQFQTTSGTPKWTFNNPMQVRERAFSGHTFLSVSPLNIIEANIQGSYGNSHTYHGVLRTGPGSGRGGFDCNDDIHVGYGIAQSVASFQRVLVRHCSTLEKRVEIDESAIDAAPFQMVKGTTLYKVHTLFTLLGLRHAYVTHCGRLIGVIALRELRETFENIYVRGAVPINETRSYEYQSDNSSEDDEETVKQLVQEDYGKRRHDTSISVNSTKTGRLTETTTVSAPETIDKTSWDRQTTNDGNRSRSDEEEEADEGDYVSVGSTLACNME